MPSALRLFRLESRDARNVLNMLESIQALRLENQMMHGDRRLGSFPIRLNDLEHCELFITIIHCYCEGNGHLFFGHLSSCGIFSLFYERSTPSLLVIRVQFCVNYRYALEHTWPTILGDPA